MADLHTTLRAVAKAAYSIGRQDAASGIPHTAEHLDEVATEVVGEPGALPEPSEIADVRAVLSGTYTGIPPEGTLAFDVWGWMQGARAEGKEADRLRARFAEQARLHRIRIDELDEQIAAGDPDGSLTARRAEALFLGGALGGAPMAEEEAARCRRWAGGVLAGPPTPEEQREGIQRIHEIVGDEEIDVEGYLREMDGGADAD